MRENAMGDDAMTTATLLTLGRPTFDVEFGAEQASAAQRVLDEIGVTTVGDDTVLTDAVEIEQAVERTRTQMSDVMIVIQATFTDASTVISISESSDIPIVVWSFPEARRGARLRLNSLCGANLAAYSLRRRRHRCAFVHTDPTAADAGDRVRIAIDDACRAAPSTPPREIETPVLDTDVVRAAERIDERLHRNRIGVIGAPPSGFEPCEGDDEQIASAVGVQVVRLELDDLFREANAADCSRVEGVIDRVSTTLSVDRSLSRDDLVPSARLYCGMRHFVDGEGLDAVATRCWPECMAEFGGAACTPHAMLTEDRVPGVCEADVLGAVTALVLQRIAGTDPFIADLVDVDESDDTSVLWHCGVASSRLAAPDDIAVGTVHPNRRVPLVNQFALRPGRVTVARLSQCSGGLHVVLAGGEMLDRPRPYDGTCGTIRWDRPVRDVAGTIFGLGVEHHLGVVYGDHRDVLVELARRWGMPVIRLGEDGFGEERRPLAYSSSNQSG
jgi:L-fucose isomerase-like protein